MSNLNNLKVKSIHLYFKYKAGSITLEEYLKQIKPLDDKIDSLEIEFLKCYLEGIPAFEKSSSKQLH